MLPVFDLSEEAVKWLADKGYDEKMGARPLARVIQEHIKKPMAEELLFGKLVKGGVVRVVVEDDKLMLLYSDLAAKQITGRKTRLLAAD